MFGYVSWGKNCKNDGIEGEIFYFSSPPNLKLSSFCFTGTTNSGTFRSSSKGLNFFFNAFSLFQHICIYFLVLSLPAPPCLFRNVVFFCLQERKEFEQKFTKEQGAMREQLQVNSWDFFFLFDGTFQMCCFHNKNKVVKSFTILSHSISVYKCVLLLLCTWKEVWSSGQLLHSNSPCPTFSRSKKHVCVFFYNDNVFSLTCNVM